MSSDATITKAFLATRLSVCHTRYHVETVQYTKLGFRLPFRFSWIKFTDVGLWPGRKKGVGNMTFFCRK